MKGISHGKAKQKRGIESYPIGNKVQTEKQIEAASKLFPIVAKIPAYSERRVFLEKEEKSTG